MRNPERIDKFCMELAELWHKVPDWRFGQLMSNILGEVQAAHGDIFFPEDATMMEYMTEVFEKWGVIKDE